MGFCWFKCGQLGTWKQIVCGIDTQYIHLELGSWYQFPMIAGTRLWLKHATDSRLICQYGCSLICCYSWTAWVDVLRQDNGGPHTDCVIQYLLKSVNLLAWSARSLHASLMEHIWGITGIWAITGLQNQCHPQKKRLCIDLSWTYIQRLYVYIQNSNSYTDYYLALFFTQ